MKLLYINIAFEGHHLDYLKALAGMDNMRVMLFWKNISLI